MSVERAYKNCKRCYELAQSTILHYQEMQDYDAKASDIRNNILHDDQIYLAMNEAMKAVSESIAESKDDGILKRWHGFYNDAFSTCVSCDFLSPGIATALEGIIRPKR